WVYDASKGKYDLETWDTAYWARLVSVVSAAETRGIIIEVSLFDAYPGTASWWADPVLRPAWNKTFNINGAFTANETGSFAPEWYDLTSTEVSRSGKKLQQYQKALIDKALQQIGSFPNVYLEV